MPIPFDTRQIIVLASPPSSCGASMRAFAARSAAMGIFGMLAGFCVACAIGQLRWRARVGAQANAEH